MELFKSQAVKILFSRLMSVDVVLMFSEVFFRVASLTIGGIADTVESVKQAVDYERTLTLSRFCRTGSDRVLIIMAISF